ncbi:leucyl aminopeptidase [Pikeienuella sp. HZG-20]|uniref:leucyl aminopeptidase n=1 Tax=Paludibacillus litoralis TaxID=3133267 RepID=UPI0030EF0609
MTQPVEISFTPADAADMAAMEGVVIVFTIAGGALSPAAATADGLTGGAVGKLVAGKEFKGEAGDVGALAFPAGMKADKLLVVGLGEAPDANAARKAGAAAAKAAGAARTTIWGPGGVATEAETAFGFALRRYRFDVYKTDDDETPDEGAVVFVSAEAEAVARASSPLAALAEGVFFTRDLVNEPANVLTTGDFAARLEAMEELGLEVEILDEARMRELGMNALLAVGMASDDESKLVVMKWNGGGDEAPLAVVGKGVVFDTGGVSIKPAAGMEDMTMDMGGAGAVCGLMRALALRKAKANVVGVVGLVENMIGGDAQRPGDIVKSMKGDTVEVINTDAEGRLVLCDALWYTQERFKPAAVIDLATLTGAIIVALGHEHAGVFSNDDAFCDAFLAAAKTAGEGAWRLPLAPAYDKLLKSRLADMKNVGGRPAGSITAAQFLQRFVKAGTPWIHLDIAGTASVKTETDLAPAGATGWGVRALNQLVADRYER